MNNHNGGWGDLAALEITVNKLAIAIQYNQKRIIVGAQWPTMQTLKTTARLKLALLKTTAREIALSMAMALIPLPSVVAA